MFRVERESSERPGPFPTPDVQAEEKSYQFGVSVRNALRAIRAPTGYRFCAELGKLVRVAECFIAGLLGRDRPHPLWTPRAQIMDVVEKGLHYYESQLIHPSAMSVPPPVFARPVQQGRGDNEERGRRKRRHE